MYREPSTPSRRFKQCRIMHRPWRVPTIIAYPPPPPDPSSPRPILALPRVATPVEIPERRVPRGAATRLRRDCLFMPDMDIAVQVFEARRRAIEMERGAVEEHVRPARPPRYLSPFEDPLVLGFLMMVAPPLAVTMVWSTRRLSRPAQIALTAYGALTTLVAGAIVVAALL
jgi:hypothetical protein